MIADLETVTLPCKRHNHHQPRCPRCSASLQCSMYEVMVMNQGLTDSHCLGARSESVTVRLDELMTKQVLFLVDALCVAGILGLQFALLHNRKRCRVCKVRLLFLSRTSCRSAQGQCQAIMRSPNGLMKCRPFPNLKMCFAIQMGMRSIPICIPTRLFFDPRQGLLSSFLSSQLTLPQLS